MSTCNQTWQTLSFEESQQAIFHTLERLASVCEKLHLRYCLAYGTLLGAARHQGFIPWDDDVDIQMPRPDYEALISHFVLNAEGLLPLKLFCLETCPEYPFGIARISDDNYRVDGEGMGDYGLGVFVDVYPYDGIGNDRAEALAILTRCAALKQQMLQASQPILPIPAGLNWKGKCDYLLRRLINKALGKHHYYNRISDEAERHEWAQSEYAGCLAWAYTSAERALFRRQQFDEFGELPFCGRKFPVPADYEAVLRQIYGDYMQWPVPELRVPRHKLIVRKRI